MALKVRLDRRLEPLASGHGLGELVEIAVGLGLIALVAGADAVDRSRVTALGPRQQVVDRIAVLAAEVARVVVACKDQTAKLPVAVDAADRQNFDEPETVGIRICLSENKNRTKIRPPRFFRTRLVS